MKKRGRSSCISSIRKRRKRRRRIYKGRVKIIWKIAITIKEEEEGVRGGEKKK